MPTASSLDDSINLLAALERAAQKEKPARAMAALNASVQEHLVTLTEPDLRNEQLLELGGILSLTLRHDLLDKSAFPKAAKNKHGWNISRLLLREAPSTITLTDDGEFIVQKGGRWSARIAALLGIGVSLFLGKAISGFNAADFVQILNSLLLAILSIGAASAGVLALLPEKGKSQEMWLKSLSAALYAALAGVAALLCVSLWPTGATGTPPANIISGGLLFAPVVSGIAIWMFLAEVISDRLGWQPALSADVPADLILAMTRLIAPQVERLGQKMPAILALPADKAS